MFNAYFTCQSAGIFKIQIDESGQFGEPESVFRAGVAYFLGMDYGHGHFYFVDVTKKRIIKANHSWEIVKTANLFDLDAHGVDCMDGRISVCNPSGMHVESFTPDLVLIDKIPIPLYEKVKYPKERIMRHHINAMQCDSKGVVYYSVTYMTDHANISHISRRDEGYVMKIVDGKHLPVVIGLHLPHSIQIKDDYIYVCTKKGSCIEKYTLDGEFVSRSSSLVGWVRGLCALPGNLWLVGLNCSRTDELAKDNPRTSAAITVLREEGNTWTELTTKNIASTEIFDIIYPEIFNG